VSAPVVATTTPSVNEALTKQVSDLNNQVNSLKTQLAEANQRAAVAAVPNTALAAENA